MKKSKKRLLCGLLAFGMLAGVFAAEASVALSAFVEGCNAFSSGEWKDAVFMLKKAASYDENNTPETYYMLISAEVYANENTSALMDCNFFFENFSDSIYISQVQYLKGRVLYNLGEYENAIVELSDFCHQYDTHNMYPIALYWIGESLFACEKYDEAQAVFERLIIDYPENTKVAAAQFKIESIAQREREEKLLYLLKQTGEEYLAAKEDYEKQLRMYNSGNVASTKQKLTEEQKKNQDLEEKIRQLEEQIEQLQRDLKEQSRLAKNATSVITTEEVYVPVNTVKTTTTTKTETNPESLKILKEKALQAQKLLDSKN